MPLWQVLTPELNFSPPKMQLSIVARPYFRNLTFPPKEMQSWQVRTSEIELFNCPQAQTSQIELFPQKNAIVAHPDFKNLTFCPKKRNYGKS